MENDTAAAAAGESLLPAAAAAPAAAGTPGDGAAGSLLATPPVAATGDDWLPEKFRVMADGKLVMKDDLDLAGGSEADGEDYLNLRSAREAADRVAIRRAMTQSEGNISSAAKLLGISRPTLYDLLKQYRMQA